MGLGRGMGRLMGMPQSNDLTKTIRIYMERDPIVFFSCVIGTFGFLAPVILGDGGRAKEDAATSYAYRIKHVYPNEK